MADRLCPEGARRDAMTDQEFWQHVLGNLQPNSDYEPASEFDEIVTPDYFHAACPVCGEQGACAYDSEGRPLIHSQTDEDDDDHRD